MLFTFYNDTKSQIVKHTRNYIRKECIAANGLLQFIESFIRAFMDQHKTKTDIEEKYIIAKELFGMKQTVVLIKFLFCRKYENLMKLFINPIHATGLFLYPLKTLENIWFSKLFF